MNCALGPDLMSPYVEELARLSPLPAFAYPNAGLPNEFGGYDMGPDELAGALKNWVEEGWVNLLGGCCGTKPEHIAAIAEVVQGARPRKPPEHDKFTHLSGLEELTIRPESNFIMIGERTNVAGSRKFARLIREENYEEALAVAKDQIEDGANLLDVNMDEGMLDSVKAMQVFLNHIASEPDISRVPIVIDSSNFEVIEAGLKCVQGKSVVNSISLKEGEEEFKQRARLIKRYGAAVVVMAFDEEKQATTVEDRIRVVKRCHKILTEEIGFDDSDLIFDTNILVVATGIEEHNAYGISFIEAARQIKELFPRCHLSGGVEQPLLFLPWQRYHPRSNALRLSISRHPGRNGHGHRQCRSASRIRGNSRGPVESRGGCFIQSSCRRYGTALGICRGSQGYQKRG